MLKSDNADKLRKISDHMHGGLGTYDQVQHIFLIHMLVNLPFTINVFVPQIDFTLV